MENFKLIQDNVNELENLGIIQRIHDFNEYLREHPTHSFLPHTYVFKPDNETTKIRMVFMSNLSENFPNNKVVSNNMAMHSGPTINSKLTTSLILLRFDPKLLIFDLKKAFCQIQLKVSDQNKLFFVFPKSCQLRPFALREFSRGFVLFKSKKT